MYIYLFFCIIACPCITHTHFIYTARLYIMHTHITLVHIVVQFLSSLVITWRFGCICLLYTTPTSRNELERQDHTPHLGSRCTCHPERNNPTRRLFQYQNRRSETERGPVKVIKKKEKYFCSNNRNFDTTQHGGPGSSLVPRSSFHHLFYPLSFPTALFTHFGIRCHTIVLAGISTSHRLTSHSTEPATDTSLVTN